MIRRIVCRRILCVLTGEWYNLTLYYLGRRSVSKEDFFQSFAKP